MGTQTTEPALGRQDSSDSNPTIEPLRPLEALRAAERLEADGQTFEALDVLIAANRSRADTEVERAIVRLRHRASHGLLAQDATADWPRDYDDPFPGSPDQIPETRPGDLTAEMIGGAVQYHGALIVRGLVAESRLSLLTDDIDHVFDACAAHREGASVAETSPWFVPFEAPDGFTIGHGRNWVIDGGGVWMVDAPRALFNVLEVFEEAGLREGIEGFLGERPALSVKKWTLRRVPIDSKTDWHQDGAFLGAGIRTMNVWVAVNRCGGDTGSPGLDLVPRRLDTIVPTGTDGAIFDWSVGRGMVDEVSGGTTVCPTFEAGDAILFDEFSLHRTAMEGEFTTPRYAIESWFFAPSSYPEDQCPILW